MSEPISSAVTEIDLFLSSLFYTDEKGILSTQTNKPMEQVRHVRGHVASALNALNELEAKSAAFDRLIHDIAQRLPAELAIKKLAGVPLAEALTDFLIVPQSDWESRRQNFRDLLSHLRAYDKQFYDDHGCAQLLHALQGKE